MKSPIPTAAPCRRHLRERERVGAAADMTGLSSHRRNPWSSCSPCITGTSPAIRAASEVAARQNHHAGIGRVRHSSCTPSRTPTIAPASIRPIDATPPSESIEASSSSRRRAAAD
jgi:hypothetical protein